jgi:hypothetical protein
LSAKKTDDPNDVRPTLFLSLHLVSSSQSQEPNLDQQFISSLTTSPEDFVEIFKNSLTLHESMKSHQSLAESRISQLRAEEAELQVVLSDAAYVSVVDEKADHPSTANSEREMRYLDQRYPHLIDSLTHRRQTLQGRDEVESQPSLDRESW